MSLGDEARAYVRRKFGECERGQLILTHEDLRYLLTQFTSESVANAGTGTEQTGTMTETASSDVENLTTVLP
jgi:ABC-type Zn uptake system ZnuABC Zn-binding protein ZnuA